MIVKSTAKNSRNLSFMIPLADDFVKRPVVLFIDSARILDSARALLRITKILVLDEATAGISLERGGF